MTANIFDDLIQAIRYSDNVDLVKYALQQGFDVNSKSSFIGTLLMEACYYERNRCVELLLDHGADPNVIDFFKCTALMLASTSNVKCIQLLLRANADLSLYQNTWTPLMRASQAGRLDCVQCLLEAGIDPSSVYQDGRTASMIARDKGHIEVAELIDNYSEELVKSALEIEDY
jgi:uncharacterized protein